MNNSLLAAGFVLVSFVLFYNSSFAGENGELTFTYTHSGLDCGKDGAGEEKENNFTIKELPEFSDYPAEEKSDKLLEYAQIETHPDEYHHLAVRPDKKYGANFNGHYFVVSGNVAQCTGCAYAEIFDTITGKKLGKLDNYQGFMPPKFNMNSSLIIENLPEQGSDLCVFNSMPPINFYQVKNNELVKIKEVKLFETEEYKKLVSSLSNQ
jgi:hypothetical protein